MIKNPVQTSWQYLFNGSKNKSFPCGLYCTRTKWNLVFSYLCQYQRHYERMLFKNLSLCVRMQRERILTFAYLNQNWASSIFSYARLALLTCYLYFVLPPTCYECSREPTLRIIWFKVRYLYIKNNYVLSNS